MPISRLKDRLLHHSRLLLMAMGVDLRLRSEDRRVLETIIHPYYAGRADVQQILSIGADWYTRGYRRQFRDRHYRVMELLAVKTRQYAGPGGITGSCTETDRFIPPASLDLILFNGVFGYGLNDRESLQQACRSFLHCLRPGGELVFGWDDVPWHAPFDPVPVPLELGFEPVTCPPLGSWRVLTETGSRHTFLFLRRPPETTTADGA
ncbi:MAG: hypothetical protein VKK62_02440 [Synechococcaceae cyanobacterium]|nr:hypothetical protein [Synechococcaceae cyanobacterium]